jgi:hypothetical protein
MYDEVKFNPDNTLITTVEVPEEFLFLALTTV